METAIHIVLLVMKFIVGWFISELADMPLGKIKDRCMGKIISNKMRGKSTTPYLVLFVINAIGCIVFLIIMIHVTCDYLDLLEHYLLTIIK